MPSFLKSHHKHRKSSVVPTNDLGVEEAALKLLRDKDKKLEAGNTDRKVERVKAKAASALIRMIMPTSWGQRAKPLPALA